ncbi:twin-arginine translocase TatA/TatE family subunit [Rheinheimera sp. UJ51]|uniref:twin-arginine translocase TatA/TatE family subunit n=1 Tax=unclassified Rheinheimera TaxID=115860 RepID=UPI001E32FC64|nr:MULTISPECIES: twin-arginine translocase TatA/TatE family subunit [unclassified Rheinheimera]MCC5452192.1 twin-arginine translocase TatA/TatE family subunit [Rheinheimera sp. UJ51]MCF4010749.1 twin-arginine translocase TatA/TatE family subunit [Rheinheimera sp. UJ63]
MGIGGVSIWQLLIILAIVVLIFGTKRLRGIGTDLGSAIKGFRSSVKDEKADEEHEDTPHKPEQLTGKADQATDTTHTHSANAEKDKR